MLHKHTTKRRCHCCGFSVLRAFIVRGYVYCSSACYGAYARHIERDLAGYGVRY